MLSISLGAERNQVLPRALQDLFHPPTARLGTIMYQFSTSQKFEDDVYGTLSARLFEQLSEFTQVFIADEPSAI